MPVIERQQKSRVFLYTMDSDPEQAQSVLGYGLNPNVGIAAIDSPAIVINPGSKYAIGVIRHGVQRELTLYALPLASIGQTGASWKKIVDVDNKVDEFALRGEPGLPFGKGLRRSPMLTLVGRVLSNDPRLAR